MSYDLSFGVSSARSPLTEREFESHFESRPKFSVGGGEAWYENQDTGVYFSFDYELELDPPEDMDEFEQDEGDEEAWVPSVASFNINFNRPSYFAFEAAPEIEAFVSAFDLPVEDPQADESATGGFDAAAFIRSWQKSNAWGCRAVRSSQGGSGPGPSTYPGEKLRTIWEWNFKKNALQDEWGEALFVPKVNFATTVNGVRSFSVWGDAIPCLLPEVDLVVLVRDELAPRRLFKKTEKEVVVASYDEIASSLKDFPRKAGSLPYLELAYHSPPPNVVKFVKSQRKAPEEINFEGVPPDQVLDEEYFDGQSSA